MFTSNGAVSNTGTSYLTGDIGSDVGAISGFGTSTVNGTIYSADAVTDQAKTDLTIAYNQLFAIPATVITHAPAYGGDETLFAGVYTIAGAGSLGGKITLDAQLDSNAIFIFRFGGAYAVGAAGEVALINGARPCNVYWVAEGAISMGAAVIMKGTLIGNNAAVSMAAGCELDGRLLSTTGAIAIDQNEASNVDLCQQNNFTLPIELHSFNGECIDNNRVLAWRTESEFNSEYFSVQRSENGEDWKQIGLVPSIGNSSTFVDYSFTDFDQFNTPNFYKLIFSDLNGKASNSKEIIIESCNKVKNDLVIYPSPSKGIIYLNYDGDINQVQSISIYNLMNKLVYSSSDFQSTIAIEKIEKSVYFIHLSLPSGDLIDKFIIAD